MALVATSSPVPPARAPGTATVREAAVAWTGLVLLTALAYGRVGELGFVWDDRAQVVGNAAVRSVTAALASFGRDTWRLADPLRAPDAYYRPLGIVSLAVDHALGGLSPRVFHLDNLALHLAVTLLLWAVLRRRAGGVAAFLGAAWFATLPVSTEAVCWIGVRFDLLGTALVLAALLVHRRYGGAGGGAMASLLVLGALLSKETFVVAPVLLLVDDLSCETRAGPRGLRAAAMRYAPHLAALVAYAALRRGSGTPSPVLPLQPVTLAIDYLTTFGETIRLLVAPLPLTVTRGYHAYRPAALAGAALGAASLVGLAVRQRHLRTGVAFLLLPCALPALVVRAQGFMGERYAYFPALGAAMVATQLLGAVGGARRLAAATAAGAVGLVLALQLGAVRGRIPDWRDDRSLFAAALRVDPESWYARFELGHAEARDGNWTRAAGWYRGALERSADPRLLSNACAAFSRIGDDRAAVRTGRMAVAASPANPRARYNLAVALAHLGALAEARAELEHALALAPSYENARELLERVRAAAAGASSGAAVAR